MANSKSKINKAKSFIKTTPKYSPDINTQPISLDNNKSNESLESPISPLQEDLTERKQAQESITTPKENTNSPEADMTTATPPVEVNINEFTSATQKTRNTGKSFLATTPKSNNDSKTEPYSRIKKLSANEISQFEKPLTTKPSKISYTPLVTTMVLTATGNFQLSKNLKGELESLYFTSLKSVTSIEHSAKLPDSLCKYLIETYGFKLLDKNVNEVLNLDIRGVHTTTANKIVAASQPFIQTTKDECISIATKTTAIATKNAMSIKPIIDAVDIIIEPEPNKAMTFIVGLIYLVYGSNAATMSLSAIQVTSLIYQEKYEQAFQQALTSTTYIILPYAMQYTPIAQKATEFMISNYPIAPVIMTIALTGSIYKLYNSLENFFSDEGHISSMTAYKNIYTSLAKIIPSYIYDFNAQAIESDISINNAKLAIETKNVEIYLETTNGDFGKKLFKHIYSNVIKEKYELLNKVICGELTLEEADNAKAKHLIIEVEARAYDHCIEVKDNFHDENKNYYHCYDTKNELLERVITGENNTIEKVELEA